MKKFFKIPMQFFAEDGDGGTQSAGAAAQADGGATNPNPDPAPQGDGQQKTEPAPTGKTFSQEDVDKIVAERLARQQKKFDTEKEEAAKLAKMNAEDKAKYAAEKREKELTAREAEIQRKELRFEALNILEENKLPAKLVDCVDLTSAETSKASIEALKTAWSEALTAAVDARLKSNPPAYGGGNNTKTDSFFEGFGL
jgi:hypothetical protein